MTKASAQQSLSRGARQIRQARARRLVGRLVLWVAVPTLAAALYYGCIASSQYQSTAIVTVQSSDQGPSLEPIAAMLAPSSAGNDTFVVRDYIRSRSMLEALEDSVQFGDHYRTEKADWWSRLAADAGAEDVYDYFRDVVQVEHDSDSGALTLKVRAYSSETAQRFAERILALAERKVNELSARARRDRIELAENEVKAAEERLGEARKKLLSLQDEGDQLDPARSAESVLAVRTQLETELAKARAELDTARSVMRSDAAEVVSLRQRVAGLERQIRRQNRRLAGTSGDGSLNESIAKFEPAMLEKEFAQKAYEGALKSLEMARVEADRQHQYLVTISEPSRPDEATHPRRGWRIATVLAASVAVMLVLSLLGAAVREHAKL